MRGRVLAAAALLAIAASDARAAPAGDLPGEAFKVQMALLEVVAPRQGAALVKEPEMLRPAALNSPIASGLPWRSGAACSSAAMATWRGRAFDTGWFGVTKASWSDMLKRVRNKSLKTLAASVPQVVISLPLLPQSDSLRHAACAEGAFDSHFRDIGAALQANGAGAAVIRLGKEANRASPPWGYDSPDDQPHYVGCFQHASRALKERAPGLKIEWTNGRQTLSSVNPLDFYPGDEAVDIIGVHYYDNPKMPRMSTQALWDAQYVETLPNGGPKGLGTWLAAARERNKKLSVSEWGMWGANRLADDPVYVENMYRFFKQNADSIAYESYFNCNAKHEIFPSTRLTKGRARYQELWSAGQ